MVQDSGKGMKTQHLSAFFIINSMIIGTMLLFTASLTYSLQTKTKASKAGAVLPAVAPPVTALACAPNSQIVAVGTYRQVQLWNVAAGRRIGVLTGMPENVNCLAFFARWPNLAAGGGVATVRGETRLFDVASGRQIGLLTGHTDLVYALAFTPDGSRLVTASGDKTLRLWNWRSGVSLHVLKDHADSVYGVACSPDGRQVASTGVDRSIKIWDAATGKPLFTFTGRAHNDTAYSLAFSPDGKLLLSAGGDHIAKLWTVGNDAENTREFRRLTGHAKAVHAAVFSADGLMIATGGAEGVVNLWSGAGGGWLRELRGAKDWIYAVCFTSDNRHVVAGTYDGQILVWRASDGTLEHAFSTRPNALHTASLRTGFVRTATSLRPAPPYSQAATAHSLRSNLRPSALNTVAAANPYIAATPEPQKTAENLYIPVVAAEGFAFPEGPAYDGKGNLAVSNCNSDHIDKVSAEGRAIQFKADPNKFTFEKTNGLTFHEDGSLYACDFGRKAILQIFPDGRTEIVADKCDDRGFKGPNDLAFDPEGNLYFTDPAGSDAEHPIGCVYRIARGTRKVTRVAEHLAFPNGLAFSADGKTLYLTDSFHFRILKTMIKPDGSLDTPTLFCQLPDKHIPDGINFDQAGNLYVATVGPGLVTIIDKTGNIARTVKLPGTDVTNLEFGGKDLKTLYVTEAQKGIVYKMQVETGGLPLFRAPNNQVR